MLRFDPLQQLALLEDGSLDLSYEALQKSAYHQYMARWLQVFRREQIHVIDGDQLITNPLPELVKIETFLGLRHRITKKNLYYDKKRLDFKIINKIQCSKYMIL